jgi:hypothetical protein
VSDEGNVIDLRPPPRPRKPDPQTVSDGIAQTVFDEDGNMRRVAAEHAQGWRERFLESFSAEVQERAKTDKSLLPAVDVARGVLLQMLEEEAWRLVFEPPQRPVYQRGELVGFEPMVQTKHIQFMLERHIPERYHLASRTELTGAGGQPLKFTFNMGDAPGELDGEAEDAEYEEA